MSRHHHRRSRRRRRTAPGSSPGVFSVDPDTAASRLSVMLYDAEHLQELPATDLAGLDATRQRPGNLWVDVDGLGSAAVLEGLGERFGIHPLALEDVVHTHQRPKVERYGDHLFVVLRLLPAGDAEPGQVSLFVGRGFVLTFHEGSTALWEGVRGRLRAGRRRIRSLGSDYLAYALLDTIVDHFFPVLEAAGEELQELEDAVLAGRADAALVGEIQGHKRMLVATRRAVWPLRDVLAALLREEELFGPEARLFLRDCYDHSVQVFDLLEHLRELASSLMELHLSALSNRMNEVMKTLTIIATIFIPLSFVAGLYGMNFDPGSSPLNMPELRWYWGYPFALGVMATIAGGLLLLFRRRGWLGGGAARREAPAAAARPAGQGPPES